MANAPNRPDRHHPLMILAMDHRDSFAKLFGVEGDPRLSDLARMRASKRLIYAGLELATPELGDARAGVLVDEHLGAQVLTEAGRGSAVVAMPVERSGQKLFSLEYGSDTDAHLAEFEPDYVKVLVRMNPADDPADLAAQLTALATLSESLRQQGRAFLYELLVPATDEQRVAAGGAEAYDREVRPGLVCQVIAANQDAGVEPTLWKIEGLETVEAAEAVVRAARAGGRDADCIVLGRDAPRATLDRWLRIAAAVDGFVGFAVGRSIWEDAVTQHVEDGDDARLIRTVAQNYLHFVTVYLDARAH
jgi:myo-inositol catabolism protein IolC